MLIFILKRFFYYIYKILTFKLYNYEKFIIYSDYFIDVFIN